MRRSVSVSERGVYGSEDADMSSDKTGEIPVRRKPKVSWARLVPPGLVGS